MGKYPNEVHFPMTMDQVCETARMGRELKKSGQIAEGERLLNSIPVLPSVAKIMKRDLGLPFLQEHRVNLYEAIEAFGEDFVEH